MSGSGSRRPVEPRVATGRAVGEPRRLIFTGGQLKDASANEGSVAAELVVDEVDCTEANGPEPWSAAEEAVIAANRAKIAELKTRRHAAAPDLHEMVIVAVRRSAPEFAVSTVGWLLQATGLVPYTVWDAAVMTSAGAAGYARARVSRRMRERESLAQRAVAERAATSLWRRHPSFAVATMLGVLSSVQHAASVDDTELEDALDAIANTCGAAVAVS